MNKNKCKYKETFNALTPSEEAVERIYEITTDKRKFSYKKLIRRVAAAAMAFVLVIGGGFGVDYIVENSNIYNSDNHLSIYIAYGSERELIKLDNKSTPQIFYKHYVNKYKYSEEKQKQIQEEFEKEIKEQLKNTSKFGQPVWGSRALIQDDNGQVMGEEYTVSCGEFLLDIEDYSAVKNITIEDTGKYGKIHLDIYTKNMGEFEQFENKLDDTGIFFDSIIRMESENPSYLFETRINNKITITGDELRTSYDSELMKTGLGENEINTGICIRWTDSGVITESIHNNIDFNLAKIKGSIFFTVNYLDGSTKKSTVDYHFDKEGYMFLSMKQ
ncbi:MAG: hypothetical protein K2I14_07025 [Eubacterium sp.]|nr:hypothetical protein [Eubacterium sp.]